MNKETNQDLSDREHTRRFPGMYTGSIDIRGLHNLVARLVSNSMRCGTSQPQAVSLLISNDNNKVVFEQDIAGPEPCKLDEIMTNYKINLVLHPFVFSTVANFLSESCHVESSCGGTCEKATYKQGILSESKSTTSTADKFSISFVPDSDIFPTVRFDDKQLVEMCRNLAYINKSTQVSFFNSNSETARQFAFAGGVADFVKHLNEGAVPRANILYAHSTVDSIDVKVALQYTENDRGEIKSFVNNQPTYGSSNDIVAAGSHIDGMLAGLAELEPQRDAESVRTGLTAVVAIDMAKPVFTGAAKNILLSEEAFEAVRKTVLNNLTIP